MLINFSKKSTPYHLSQFDVFTPFNGWKWSRSPAIGRSGVEVVSLWCYTRRIDRDALQFHGSGKWISISPAPTFHVTWPARRTNTAKPTASAAECGSGRHSASFLATTGSVSLGRSTLVSPSPTPTGSAAITTWCFVREPAFGTRRCYMVAWPYKHEHNRGQGIRGLLSGRLGAD